jgi:hypothetical protein
MQITAVTIFLITFGTTKKEMILKFVLEIPAPNPLDEEQTPIKPIAKKFNMSMLMSICL